MAASRALLRASTAETGFESEAEDLCRSTFSPAGSGFGDDVLKPSVSPGAEGVFDLLFFFCLLAIAVDLLGAGELLAETSLDAGDSSVFCCCLLALNAAAALCGAVQASLSDVLDRKNDHVQVNARAGGASEPEWSSIFRLFTIIPSVARELESWCAFSHSNDGKIWSRD